MPETIDRSSGPVAPVPEPPEPSPAMALNSLLLTLRRHPLVFFGVFAVCVVAAVGYLAHRSTTYSATAQVLVTPIPATDTSYIGLPLIRASELEPQRAAATAAPLLASTAADEATAAATGLTTDEVTAGVNVAAVPESNLVAITATSESAAGASELADSYAEASIQVREEFLKPQVRRAIANAEHQRELLPEQVGAEANNLGTRISNLRTILRQGDPTLAFARPASEGKAEGAASTTIVLIAIFAGAVIAGLTAVMIELLTARPIAVEEELEALYPLPILARIPAGGRREREKERLRWARGGASPAVRDGFRTLRGRLNLSERERGGEGARPDDGRRSAATVMLVSPEEMEARTIASLDLARAFAAAEEEANVIELDLNRPRLAAALGAKPRGDLGNLLRAEPPRNAVTPLAREERVGLIVAPADPDPRTQEALAVNSGRLVESARATADWLVIDAPPVAEATADVVSVLAVAEHLVVVVALGTTHPEALLLLRETLEQQGRTPDGYVILTGAASRASRAP